MSDEIKPDQATNAETANEASKIDNKEKVIALALLKPENVLKIFAGLAAVALVVILAMSGYKCGAFEKAPVNFTKPSDGK